MRVIFENGKFTCHCSFDERFIAQDAGFTWDEKVRKWTTYSEKIAARLRQFCDEGTLKRLAGILITEHQLCSSNISIPRGFKLHSFQKEAIRFALSRNRSYLGLDPGLGKTVCAAVITETLKPRVAIYICPPFLVSTVQEEFCKWAPTSQILICPDSKLKHFIGSTLPIDLLIVDEAHRFKTDTSYRTKYLFETFTPRAKHMVFMSGTPMPNSPIELFPILSNAAPECINFRNKFDYALRYCAAYKTHFGWDYSGHSHLDELRQNIMPKFMLRMKKEDVLKELPPKIESLVILESKMPARLARMDRELLKHFSPEDLHKYLAPNGHIATYRKELGIAKVPFAVSFIKSILEETEESILIFAIHKDVIHALDEELCTFMPYVVTGDTPMDERHRFVAEFQNSSHRRVFLGNIQACGTGFTLTKATRVIFVEFAWTPSDNDQASDRAHRIGQKDSVLVNFLVYRNSVDRAVLETILKKREVIKNI